MWMKDVPIENAQNCNYLLNNIFAVTMSSKCLIALVDLDLSCVMLR
jgi:hypothetical protein